MKNRKNIIYICIIFLITLVILAKLFLNARYQGHDTIFHVTNIIKLSKTISFDNIFGSNIITYDFNKFGYGVWLFYPKLPHLITSYIYLITNNIYLSMNIIYFITTLLSGIFTFFLSKKIFHDRNIALLSSIIYIIVPYHICEIYVRDAFSENFMFFVLPMIFLGLYNLKENNYLKFYIFFILGYVIGMNSHLVSMVFYTFFVGLFILYYWKVFLKKDKIKALLLSTLIVIGIILPYLVNLIEHKLLNIYRVYTEYFTTLYGVKISSLKISSLYNQMPIFNNVMTYFNIVTIILFLMTTLSFIFNKKDKYKKDKKILFIFIIIVVNLVCSKVIWDYVPSLLLSIQFPWRLLVLLSLLVALFSPLILINKNKFCSIRKIILIVIILLLTFEGINNISYYTEKEITVDDALNSEISMGFQNEYFPCTEDIDGELLIKYGMLYYQLRDYGIISNNNVSIEITEDNFPNMEFVVEDLVNDTIIEFPRIFYLGYELIDEEDEEVSLYNNENGFLTATIDKNGTYKLVYVKTKLNRLAEIIRLTTILIVFGVLAVKFIKWKERKLQF